MTVHCFPLTIYFEDTDCNGVVYHANYLKFMERARSDYIQQKGFSFRASQQQHIMFAVCRAEVNYVKPAYLEDKVVVVTQVHKIGRASITFQQTVRNYQQPALIYCEGMIKIACINQELKPRALPESLLREMQSEF